MARKRNLPKAQEGNNPLNIPKEHKWKTIPPGFDLEQKWIDEGFGDYQYINMPSEFRDDSGMFVMDSLYQDYLKTGRNPSSQYMHLGNPNLNIGPNFKRGGDISRGKLLRRGGEAGPKFLKKN